MPLQRPTQLGLAQLSQMQLIWMGTSAAFKGTLFITEQFSNSHPLEMPLSSACLMSASCMLHILTVIVVCPAVSSRSAC